MDLTDELDPGTPLQPRQEDQPRETRRRVAGPTDIHAEDRRGEEMEEDTSAITAANQTEPMDEEGQADRTGVRGTHLQESSTDRASVQPAQGHRRTRKEKRGRPTPAAGVDIEVDSVAVPAVSALHDLPVVSVSDIVRKAERRTSKHPRRGVG
jgi:hypothetical protein